MLPFRILRHNLRFIRPKTINQLVLNFSSKLISDFPTSGVRKCFGRLASTVAGSDSNTHDLEEYLKKFLISNPNCIKAFISEAEKLDILSLRDFRIKLFCHPNSLDLQSFKALLGPLTKREIELDIFKLNANSYEDWGHLCDEMKESLADGQEDYKKFVSIACQVRLQLENFGQSSLNLSPEYCFQLRNDFTLLITQGYMKLMKSVLNPAMPAPELLPRGSFIAVIRTLRDLYSMAPSNLNFSAYNPNFVNILSMHGDCMKDFEFSNTVDSCQLVAECDERVLFDRVNNVDEAEINQLQQFPADGEGLSNSSTTDSKTALMSLIDMFKAHVKFCSLASLQPAGYWTVEQLRSLGALSRGQHLILRTIACCVMFIVHGHDLSRSQEVNVDCMNMNPLFGEYSNLTGVMESDKLMNSTRLRNCYRDLRPYLSHEDSSTSDARVEAVDRVVASNSFYRLLPASKFLNLLSLDDKQLDEVDLSSKDLLGGWQRKFGRLTIDELISVTDICIDIIHNYGGNFPSNRVLSVPDLKLIIAATDCILATMDTCLKESTSASLTGGIHECLSKCMAKMLDDYDNLSKEAKHANKTGLENIRKKQVMQLEAVKNSCRVISACCGDSSHIPRTTSQIMFCTENYASVCFRALGSAINFMHCPDMSVVLSDYKGGGVSWMLNILTKISFACTKSRVAHWHYEKRSEEVYLQHCQYAIELSKALQGSFIDNKHCGMTVSEYFGLALSYSFFIRGLLCSEDKSFYRYLQHEANSDNKLSLQATLADILLELEVVISDMIKNPAALVIGRPTEKRIAVMGLSPDRSVGIMDAMRIARLMCFVVDEVAGRDRSKILGELQAHGVDVTNQSHMAFVQQLKLNNSLSFIDDFKSSGAYLSLFNIWKHFTDFNETEVEIVRKVMYVLTRKLQSTFKASSPATDNLTVLDEEQESVELNEAFVDGKDDVESSNGKEDISDSLPSRAVRRMDLSAMVTADIELFASCFLSLDRNSSDSTGRRLIEDSEDANRLQGLGYRVLSINSADQLRDLFLRNANVEFDCSWLSFLTMNHHRDNLELLKKSKMPSSTVDLTKADFPTSAIGDLERRIFNQLAQITRLASDGSSSDKLKGVKGRIGPDISLRSLIWSYRNEKASK